ncbi:MAG: hypothetical protein KAK00_07885 [Nanoarchaeota archaeon]|nr:hypothetical protein [Nanoarchaeota archaeon]
MEEAELVKKMIGQLENKQNSRKKNPETLLKDINETRTVSLKEGINEILNQVRMRESLHEQMMGDLENLKSSINNMMPQGSSATAEFQKTMTELRKKLIEAEEMKIQEKLNCSRDIALLKKELREIMKEFRDKEKRATLLGDILAE